MQFLPLIGVVLSSLIIYYVINLEKIGCQCAMGYKRTYILAYNAVAILYGVSVAIFGTDKFASMLLRHPLLFIIPGLLAAAGILNIVFTLMFVEDMKKKNCECSKSIYRDMMYVLAIIQAVSVGLAILVGGYAGYMYSKTSGMMSKMSPANMDKIIKMLGKASKRK
jgi:hypothetical protein